jgi:hypothetical protein
MEGKLPIEWNDIWDTKRLHVTQIKRENRSIYTISNPLNDDAINVEGKELVAFCKYLLNEVESESE